MGFGQCLAVFVFGIQVRCIRAEVAGLPPLLDSCRENCMLLRVGEGDAKYIRVLKNRFEVHDSSFEPVQTPQGCCTPALRWSTTKTTTTLRLHAPSRSTRGGRTRVATTRQRWSAAVKVRRPSHSAPFLQHRPPPPPPPCPPHASLPPPAPLHRRRPQPGIVSGVSGGRPPGILFHSSSAL